MLGLRQKILITFAGLSLLLITVAGQGTVVIERVSQSFAANLAFQRGNVDRVPLPPIGTKSPKSLRTLQMSFR
jgi:hypothetical protein